jgi:fluoroquinolone transport system permease protein
MTPAALRTLIAADVRVLWRDPLLVWMTAMPIGMAALIRSVVRVVENLLADSNFDLSPYYPLIMGGYLMTAPGLIGFVVGFLLLDERDAGTLRALRVTPLPTTHYLAYRIAGPLVVGTVATIVGYRFVGLSPIPMPALTAIALIASVSAPLLALVLAAASPNKVAGFAVLKVLNAVNLLPIAAFFLPPPVQYLAGVLPTYWPMRALWSAATGAPYWPFLAIGGVVGAVAVVVAARVFQRRLMAS